MRRSGADPIRWWAAVALLLLIPLMLLPVVGVLATSVAVSPEAIESGETQLSEPCPAALAGTGCWTCGLTRSFTAMSRARVGDAVGYNRLGPPLWLMAWATALLLAWIFAQVARREVFISGRPGDSSAL